MTGSTLSHYKIVSELGRGGMGIVYLGEDTKLDRQVAIKVLPASALSSEGDRARFYREAKAAAALNHPNIAQIYQIDEAVPSDAPHGTQPSPFIAMEYIDGEPLDERIKRGPLKLSEAVRLATQMAGALGEAHEKGIVHRDVKASNVMLTSKGDAKVLDFGLALTAASTKLTRMGSTLGTVAYMSPEQARGEEVDKRTDLWALGVVLYEMVSGRNPFGGDYEQAVVYSILNAEPEPLTAVRTGVPMELERIVRKLLSKDAGRRYQTTADLVADLSGLDVGSPLTSTITNGLSQAPVTRRSTITLSTIWPFFGTFLLGCAVVWLAITIRTPRPSEKPVYRFEMVLPVGERISDLAVSPDGSSLAYTIVGGPINVYDFNSGTTRVLEGTEDAAVFEFSPDGSTLLITTALGVKRSSASIGTSVDLFFTDEGTPRANWAPGERFVYENENRIFIGTGSQTDDFPVVLSDTTGLEDLDWPSVLPDGRTVMATIERSGTRRELGFWDIDTGRQLATVDQGGYRPRYVPSGHIVMVLGTSTQPGSLVAMPFDIDQLRQTGQVIPIAEGVVAERTSISETGTLIYSLAQVRSGFDESSLVHLYMDGRADTLQFPRAVYQTIRVSPDGTKAVVSVTNRESTSRQGDALDTIVLDLASGVSIPLTTGATGGTADWFTGSDSVVYVDNGLRSQGIDRVMVRAADASGQARELFRSSLGIHDLDASPDGSLLAYSTGLSALGSTQLELRDLKSGATVQLSDGTPARRRRPVVSPDGSMVFYQEENRLFTRSTDGSGVPTTPGGGGLIPVWESVSGTKFGYGQNSDVIWRGLDSPVREVVTVRGIVRAMDAMPGGESLLIAISPADGRDVELSGGRSDSLQTVQVILNVFEQLK